MCKKRTNKQKIISKIHFEFMLFRLTNETFY